MKENPKETDVKGTRLLIYQIRLVFSKSLAHNVTYKAHILTGRFTETLNYRNVFLFLTFSFFFFKSAKENLVKVFLNLHGCSNCSQQRALWH